MDAACIKAFRGNEVRMSWLIRGGACGNTDRLQNQAAEAVRYEDYGALLGL